MGEAITKFERLIGRINVVYGLILPVLCLTLSGAFLWILAPEYFQPNSLSIYVITLALTTLVFTYHFSNLKNLKRYQTKLLYIYYHVTLVVYTVFVAPTFSPSDYLWLTLAIGVDLMFGKKMMLLSISVFAGSLLGSIIHTDQPMTFTILFNAISELSIIFVAALLVSKYRQVSDAERLALDKTFATSSFERQRLLSLINNMGEAVVATDEEGKILLYNAAVLNLLDTNKSLENTKLSSSLNLLDKAGKTVDIVQLVKARTVGLTSTDYRHQYKPGDEINLYINIAPVKLGFQEKSQSGFIVIMRDITREKSLEEERDEFISVVSHELRTPVAIAEGNISNAMFMNEKKMEVVKIKNSLNQAHDQVVFLGNMINDLATLSRAERSDISIEVTEIDPVELLEKMATGYKSEAKVKKLDLNFTAGKDVKKINTSQLYLQEILQNFIVNAIKYTQKGHVLLHVRSNEAGDAVFSISDTGIGLSKADQKRVFEKFFRSEDYRTRENSGTGLGLYVTSKLANRLGALIELESELNKGSTFTVTAPSMKKKHH